MRQEHLTRAKKALLTVVLVTTVAVACFGLSAFIVHRAAPRFELTSTTNFSITSAVYTTYTAGGERCTGTSTALLYPGTARCLQLTVTNPLHVSIKVTSLTVTSVARSTTTTTHASCNPTKATFSTFTATDFSGSLSVPSGATHTASIARPLTWRSNGTQDNCQGATFTFTYKGAARYTTTAAAPPTTNTTTTTSPTTPPAPPATGTHVATGTSSSPTGSTGTVVSKDPTTGVTAVVNATGVGAVTMSQLTSAPKAPPATLTVGALVDVRVSAGSSFTKLTEKVCGPKVGTAITWYDTATGTWVSLTPTAGPTLSTGTPPCVSFSLGPTSSPTIAQLTGTAFAVGTTIPPGSPIVTRVAGATADATAAAELVRAFPYADGSCPPTRTVVVATTAVFQDALSSQFLAQHLTTGTLLTPTLHLASVTATTLRKEGITHVDIVGGTLAVSATVATAIGNLRAYECGGATPTPSGATITVQRIDGQSAYATAMRVAESAGSAGVESFPGAYSTTNATGGTGRYNDTPGVGSAAPSGALPTAILASGEEFQDAQAASVVAYHTGLPLLLTPATSLSETAVAAITTLGIRQVVLVGGTLAVTNSVEAALVAQTGVSVLRIAGQDASDTARELARFEAAGGNDGLGWTPGHRILVARGNGFTDGLAGAVLESPRNVATGASGTARPLLLTQSPSVLGPYLTTFLRFTGHTGIGKTSAKTTTGLTVLGGTLAVTGGAVAAMETALSR